jgi:hypothetical protein
MEGFDQRLSLNAHVVALAVACRLVSRTCFKCMTVQVGCGEDGDCVLARHNLTSDEGSRIEATCS